MEDTKSPKYLFWFVALEHSRQDEYIKHLDKYIDPSASLIVAKEVAKGVHHSTKGQHFHIAADMELETYNKFHRNIHVEQLKLRRKANEKGGKQVGRVKNVRDETKMLSYTVKSDNLYTRNMDLVKLQEYIELSYPKKDDWDNDLIEYLKLNVMNNLSLDDIENKIIDFYITNKKKKLNLTRSKIKQITLRYLMYEIPFNYEVRNQIKYIL